MQHKNRIKLLLNLLTFLSCFFFLQAYSQNLIELATQAKQHDHTYLQALEQNKVSKLQYEVDRGDIFPQLTAAPLFQYNNSNHQSTSSTGISITLSHTFQIANYKKLSIDQYQSMSAQLSDIVAYQQLLNRLSLAYFTVTQDQEILSLLNKKLATSQSILTIVKQQYHSGKRTHTDVLNTQAQLNSDQVAVINQQKTLAQDQSKLQTITGSTPGHLAELNNHYPFTDPLPLNSKQILATTTAHNPQVLASHLTAMQYLAAIHQVKSTRLPTLQTSVSYSASSESNSPIGSGGGLGESGTSAQLTLNIPIIQPGVSASVMQAEKKYDQELEAYQLEKSNVMDSLRQAYNNLINDHKQINKLITTLTTDKAALKNTIYAYQGGLQDLSAVLNAETTVYSQQQNNILAKYDYLTNLVNLHNAMGTLDLSMLSHINKWLH